MIASLINLSSLILLLGGKKTLEPFEYLRDCRHYHLTDKALQQHFIRNGQPFAVQMASEQHSALSAQPPRREAASSVGQASPQNTMRCKECGDFPARISNG